MRFLGRCNNFYLPLFPLLTFAVLIAVVSLVLFPIVVLIVACVVVAVASWLLPVVAALGCGRCKQEIVICNPLCVHRKLDNLIWLKVAC